MSVERNSQYPPLETMVFKLWKNQQRQRRWKWVKRIGWFVAVCAISVYSSVPVKQKTLAKQSSIQTLGLSAKPHAAIIDLKGMISESADARYTGFSDIFIKKLQLAFANPNLTAVVLRIDSPGGDVVSTQIIHRIIKDYQRKHPTIPIFAVCEGICASGAYYIASTCNEIYVHPASIVGSIGVRGADSIGFVELFKKIGAERRILTAGKYANFLDPFLPLTSEELEITKSMLNEVHNVFIKAVKAGRGNRLKDIEKNSEMLFSGQVWSGRQALALGLVDGFHTVHSLQKNVLKTQKFVYYLDKPDLMSKLRRLTSFFEGQLKMFMHSHNHAIALLAPSDPIKSY